MTQIHRRRFFMRQDEDMGPIALCSRRAIHFELQGRFLPQPGAPTPVAAQKTFGFAEFPYGVNTPLRPRAFPAYCFAVKVDEIQL
jgi:hypothetical protein